MTAERRAPWGFLIQPEPDGAMLRSAAPGTVAIVMRTRDRPLLLRRALASVVGQEFDRWHLTIVNDGGDRAPVEALVAEYGERLAGRATVLHNDVSLGMEAASNQALATADASCFVIHDDDDSWDPRFLAEAVGFLDQPAHAALVGVATGFTRVYERIEQDRIIVEERVPDRDVAEVADLERLLVINRAMPICLLFRMSLIRLLGGFNAALPVIGDWEFNIRALLVGDIGLIPAPLAFYHLRRAPPSAAYANSVVADRGQHAMYSRLVRNSVTRRAVAGAPELLGVLQPVVHAIAAARDATMAHVNRVAQALVEQQNRNNAMLVGEMLEMLAQHEERIAARIAGALQSSRS